MVSLMEAMTPFFTRVLITSAAVFHAAGQPLPPQFPRIFTVRGVFLMTPCAGGAFSPALGAGLLLWNFPPFFVVFGLAADFLLAAGDILDPLETRVSTRSSNPVRS